MASNFIGGGIWAPAEDSSAAHTSVSETPAPIHALQPPASNSGSDDPTAGISKEAGGLSSTSGIGSPVTAEAEQQSVVGSVLEYAFGKKERTAEEVDAAAPSTSSVTAGPTHDGSSAGTYLGAIAAAGGAAVASLIPGMASATGAEPHASTSSPEATATADPVSGSGSIGAIGGGTETPSSREVTTTSSTTTSSEPAVAASSTPADIKSATAMTEEKSTTAATDDKGMAATTSDKTLGEKAAEATESVKASANEAAASAKEAVTGEKTTGEAGSDKPKPVSDHEAAIRENKDAIPTAGGEKLGAAHEGESKVIPDVPKPAAADETANVSSSASQPDSTTADNTAKNTGAVNNTATLPPVAGKKGSAEGSSDKPKFMDRLKSKLHIGDKKDKS